MFGCVSPFKIGTHSSLKISDWADFPKKYFWKHVGSIQFWLSHWGKKIKAKFGFWKGLNIWTLLYVEEGKVVLFGTECQILG